METKYSVYILWFFHYSSFPLHHKWYNFQK